MPKHKLIKLKTKQFDPIPKCECGKIFDGENGWKEFDKHKKENE